MPLLSKLVDNRFNSSGTARVTVRYCDSLYRHHISGPTFCSFVAPEITSLVPDEQKHKRLREGGESSHYSFNSIQSASLLLRLNKRFESVENDRQENIVDILNDINNRFKESNIVLQKVSNELDSEGTVCQLLKNTCDAVKELNLSTESPHLATLSQNTSSMVEYAAEQISEAKELKNELALLGPALKELQNNHMTDVKSSLESFSDELNAIKCETQLESATLERIEGQNMMNGLEMKQELTELRHEMILLKEELRSLKNAIIDDLPSKLMAAFHPKSSSIGSDISIVDPKSEEIEDEEEVEEEEEDNDEQEDDDDSNNGDDETEEYGRDQDDSDSM